MTMLSLRARSTAIAAGLLAALSLAGPARATTVVELELLNRTYSDLAGEIAPLRYDPLTIRLSSPSQTVTVRRHRVGFDPLGGGRFRTAIEVEISGKGSLVADLDFGSGQPQRMTDEVVLPPQTLRLEAEVRVERGKDGYRVTALSLPPAIRVDIRSRLVGDILEACAGLSLLTLGALDCSSVTDALERPSVPLPGPGAELWIADTDLTAEDRAEIDALLAGN